MLDVLPTSNPSKIGLIEFYTRVRHNRFASKEKWPDLPLRPVDRVPPFVIPSATCTSDNEKLRVEVERALQKIDPGFRIIYDPLTAVNGGPGYHLYREEKCGFPGGHSKLILEFSVQRDVAREWPHGEPCHPGMWFVDVVKRHMKPAQRSVERRLEWESRADSRESREQKESDELRRLHYEEVFKPVWVKGKLGRTGTSKDLRRNTTNVRRRESAKRTRVVARARGGKYGDRHKIVRG